MPQLLNDNNIVYVGFDGLVPVETATDENLVYAIKDSNEKLMFGIDDQGYAYFNKEDEDKQIVHVFETTNDMKTSAYIFDYALVLNDNPNDKVVQLYIGSDTATNDSIACYNERYAIPVFKTMMPSISHSNNDNGVYIETDQNGKILFTVDNDGEILFKQNTVADDHVIKVFDTILEAETSAYLYQYVIVTADDYTGGLYKVTDERTSYPLHNGKYLKLVYTLYDVFSHDNASAAYCIKSKNNKILMAIDEEGEPITTSEPLPDNHTIRMFNTVNEMRNSAYDFDYAMTAGFHSPNDGGAAVYRVVTGVTGNGMDIIQMANKRCAQLITATTMYVEQFGMKKADENYNIAPIIARMVAVGVIDVRFHAGLYWAKSPTVVTAQHSLHISGHDCWKNYEPRNHDDPNNPRQGSTCIYFRSTRTDTGAAVFAFEYRNVCIENMFLYNMPNPGDPGRVGIYCYMYDSLAPDWAPDIGHYGYIFKRLFLYNFDRGFELLGKVKWDCQFDDVRVTGCRIGMYLGGDGNMLCSFRLFYTDHCSECGIRIAEGTLCASFWSCNFGSYGKVIEWVKYGEDPEDYDNGMKCSATFYDCNFETDSAQNDVDGFFVRTANHYNAQLTFIGCEFSVRQMPNMPNSTALSFGSHTSVVFENCRAFDTNNETAQANFYANRHCLKSTGAITFIGRNDGMPLPQFTDGYEGCILDLSISGNRLPTFKTLNNIYNINPMNNGQQFYVIDEDSLYIKKQNEIIKIA